MWFIAKIKKFFSLFKFDDGAKLDLNLEDQIFDEISEWNIEKVESLINKWVDLEKEWFGWQTPLMAASIEWQKEIVKLLIENWADVNAKTKDWLWVLDRANEWWNDEIVQLLKRHWAE